MTLWNEINEIPSSSQDLRKFGLTLAAAFGLLTAVLVLRGRSSWPYFLGASGSFLLFGLVLPSVLKPLQKVWMMIALLMGWVMSRAILCALFFLVVTPTGIFMRLSGKDPLEMDLRTKKESYWHPRKARSKDDDEHQF